MCQKQLVKKLDVASDSSYPPHRQIEVDRGGDTSNASVGMLTVRHAKFLPRTTGAGGGTSVAGTPLSPTLEEEAWGGGGTASEKSDSSSVWWGGGKIQPPSPAIEKAAGWNILPPPWLAHPQILLLIRVVGGGVPSVSREARAAGEGEPKTLDVDGEAADPGGGRDLEHVQCRPQPEPPDQKGGRASEAKKGEGDGVLGP